MAQIRTKRKIRTVFRKYLLTVLMVFILFNRPDNDLSEIRFGLLGNDHLFLIETSTMWHLNLHYETKKVLAKVTYVDLSTEYKKIDDRYKNLKLMIRNNITDTMSSAMLLDPVEDSEDEDCMQDEDEDSEFTHE